MLKLFGIISINYVKKKSDLISVSIISFLKQNLIFPIKWRKKIHASNPTVAFVSITTIYRYSITVHQGHIFQYIHPWVHSVVYLSLWYRGWMYRWLYYWDPWSPDSTPPPPLLIQQPWLPPTLLFLAWKVELQ